MILLALDSSSGELNLAARCQLQIGVGGCTLTLSDNSDILTLIIVYIGYAGHAVSQ